MYRSGSWVFSLEAGSLQGGGSWGRLEVDHWFYRRFNDGSERWVGDLPTARPSMGRRVEMMSIGTGNTMVELSRESGRGWRMVEDLTL